MTYYNYSNYSYNYNPYENYEFTAFVESDLVSGNLDCGDTFTMPDCASVCITVKDNDKYLSGDSKCNERADDSHGQWANIESSNGDELGNGGQIYGEVYWWVKDQDGNWYVMIEIEQEGGGGDYFTFYTGGGYSIPPAGAELKVYSSENIRDCGWNPDFRSLGAGECEPPTGSISGTVFCDTDCDGINGVVKVIPGCDYTIEAEKMWDCGFETFYSHTASGGKGVKLKCYDGYGELATRFDGKDGTYDVKIRVQDEKDGQSVIKLYVGGKYVEAVRLDEDDDGSGNDHGGYSTYVIKDVHIEKGETIKLKVYGDDGEYVRIDKIDLKGEDKTEIVSEPTKAGVTIKLLDIDGNVVATTTTDSNGNYEFIDVPVGQYKIMGVAPNGTEFTIQDVHGNTKDDIDSDVDENGMSGVITVTKDGKTDIDLGVCEKENQPPEPQPDTAKTCADETVTVDVLDNDTDPDGDPLTITKINGQAITEGGPAVDAAGVLVSLVGGELVFDGSATYEYLGVGESMTQSFTYTIDDGSGGVAAANVDVTFCGLYETFEELEQSLPIGEICFQIVDNNLPSGSSDEAYSVLITNADGDARFDNVTFTATYCVGAYEFILAEDPVTGRRMRHCSRALYLLLTTIPLSAVRRRARPWPMPIRRSIRMNLTT